MPNISGRMEQHGRHLPLHVESGRGMSCWYRYYAVLTTPRTYATTRRRRRAWSPARRRSPRPKASCAALMRSSTIECSPWFGLRHTRQVGRLWSAPPVLARRDTGGSAMRASKRRPSVTTWRGPGVRNGAETHRCDQKTSLVRPYLSWTSRWTRGSQALASARPGHGICARSATRSSAVLRAPP